jgi:ribosomal protein S27AE
VRYWTGHQEWNPFTREPVEFARLNYDFHPRQVQAWCEEVGFRVEQKLAVSHFRSPVLKRWLPVGALTALDAALQPTGRWWQFTPSVFYRLRAGKSALDINRNDLPELQLFRCPKCGHTPLSAATESLVCGQCGRHWGMRGGIYDFRSPLRTPQD